ncbi:hypothetical protein HK405_002266, partial [Cladochytrium tenue]
ERAALLTGLLAATPHTASEADLTELARATDGWSRAAMAGGCREAALAALRDDVQAPTVAPRFLRAAFGLR